MIEESGEIFKKGSKVGLFDFFSRQLAYAVPEVVPWLLIMVVLFSDATGNNRQKSHFFLNFF